MTIFGESAGASSVEYLMLSPMASGLFHRAISQSGSVLNPWAMMRQPRDRAFRLGEVLGFKTNNTDDLLAFLRKVSPRKLIDAAPKTITHEDSRKNIGLPFVPSIENWQQYEVDSLENAIFEETFMSEEPMAMLKAGKVNRVPYMTGFNSQEAMLFMRRLRKDPTLLDTIEKDFVRLVPIDLKVPGGRDSTEAHSIAKTLREFYLGSRSVSTDNLEEMMTVRRLQIDLLLCEILIYLLMF